MILCDTSTALWLYRDPGQLSARALAALEEARRADGIALADISLWEVALLHSLGRITLPSTLETFLHHLERYFVVLPLSADVARRAAELVEPYPKDPADRIIGATAATYDLGLVTRDKLIRRSGRVRCIW